jgi:hypothetical protein
MILDACKDNAFLCKNRKCISYFLVCNKINNCGGDNGDESSCPILNTASLFGKFIGGIVGGVAGFIVLLVAIIVIIIGIFICKKRCPLYNQRQRIQPPVVVIDAVLPAPEENAHESLSLINNDH